MSLIEFIIGALIVNSLAHTIFGLTKTRYLGLFGYSPKGNIGYGVLQLVLVVILLLVNYSYEEILQNGFVIGGLFILALFLVFGKFSIRFFEEKDLDKKFGKMIEQANRNDIVSEKEIMNIL